MSKAIHLNTGRLPPPNNDLRELEPLTDILLRGTVDALLQAGLPRNLLAAELETMARRVESGDSLRAARSDEFIVLRKVCDIVHDWCDTPACTLPATGQPCPLWLHSGEVTLAELIQRHCAPTEVNTIVAYMEQTGVILFQDNGAYALTRPANLVMLESESRTAVDRLANMVLRQLRAALHNFRTADQPSKNLERDTYVAHLPAKHLPAFRKFCKQQGQNFLEIIDAWLTRRSSRASAEPTVEAGVHVYGYHGVERASRKMLRGRKTTH